MYRSHMLEKNGRLLLKERKYLKNILESYRFEGVREKKNDLFTINNDGKRCINSLVYTPNFNKISQNKKDGIVITCDKKKYEQDIFSLNYFIDFIQTKFNNKNLKNNSKFVKNVSNLFNKYAKLCCTSNVDYMQQNNEDTKHLKISEEKINNFLKKSFKSYNKINKISSNIINSDAHHPNGLVDNKTEIDGKKKEPNFVETLLNDIVKIYLSKIPKGFERFEKSDSNKNCNGNINNAQQEEEKPKKFDNNFFYLFILLLLCFLLFVDSNSLYNEITQNDFFYNYLSKGYVDKIKLINKDYVKAYLNSHGINKYHLKYVSFRVGNSDSFERKVELIQKEMNIKLDEIIEVQYVNEGNLVGEIKSYIPSILFFLFLVFIFQKITLKNVANSGMDKLFKFNKINPINKNNYKTDIKFSSVAGMKQAKEEIMEFVDFLKNPSKYQVLGAKIPKGALLCGAPGTGKTLLAKAVAGEANVPFFNISGSDFIEVFVGIGPSRVRELFAQARKHAPSIIFIDEIDAVGRKRSKGGFAGGGNDERENTLNQMLVEMDGFHTSNDQVVVLAGTNRVDILDPAITRPGRFDRIVNINKPDINERSEIFQVHLKNLKLHDSLDIKNISYILASLTPGFVGADIANVVNEGAIQCARRSHIQGVQMHDFELAIERVLGGLAKSTSLISPLEKKTISYHETGHALIGWFLEFADPVLKVSIIPRSNGALGYSQHLSEEIMLFSKEAIHDKIAVILGGRAAEELFIGKITTGAIDDLNKVTQLAYSYVSQYGMNKEIGLVSFQQNGGNNGGSEYAFYRPHSECLAHLIDNEARNLIESQYNRVKAILKKNEKHVHNLANLLYEKETISYHDIVKCVGERPYPIKSNYEKFVKANPYKMNLSASIEEKTGEKAEEADSEHAQKNESHKDATNNEHDKSSNNLKKKNSKNDSGNVNGVSHATPNNNDRNKKDEQISNFNIR
ncbi:ATP-dependent zinc metalloprotease FTSH, putative [Plasmodium chabaudi chabaudi]|uniref:ATP-dependent zinc metalloprotease FTSH, putative n=1 Tax=Plasmodium chabaudi chabaudi TaxID=31271 RepID=A0A1C6YF69_PLACU|nr:ATP-dependent zinc metalloprotease FTSH, putative [Plasmodium chabaudi chabaudi]SCN60327.1 ATP-dependent zinc metalloprotease FTSH, putative [Plasmodium chabaudi chabaudi]